MRHLLTLAFAGVTGKGGVRRAGLDLGIAHADIAAATAE
jgi:hypothetical protein